MSRTGIASGKSAPEYRIARRAGAGEPAAAALNKITATVQSTAESAKHAREIVSTTKDEAEHSGAIMRQAEDAMSAIQTSSQKISKIIGVIDEIAFQTNLLAPNAGVADIDASSREQSTGVREINTAINPMDQFTQQNAAKVEETAAAGHHLSQEAEQLARLVSEFKVSSESAPRGQRDNISQFRNIA